MTTVKGGGFKSPLFGEDGNILTNIFQMGWNPKKRPVYIYSILNSILDKMMYWIFLATYEWQKLGHMSQQIRPEVPENWGLPWFSLEQFVLHPKNMFPPFYWPWPLCSLAIETPRMGGLGAGVLDQQGKKGNAWMSQRVSKWLMGSGQIIVTSHDLTPDGGLVREIPLFQGNLGWWNIIIWPDGLYSTYKWDILAL